MRAVAVMLVVVAHAGLGNVVPGGSGVTIFFAISGFIITDLLLRERDKTVGFDIGGFYFRRAAKIFPPFLFIVIIPTLVWAFFGPLDWWDFLSQVFFVFNWVYIASPVEILPGSAVVWSLAIEEQFYIAFAIVWLLLVRASWWKTALTALAGATVAYSLLTRLILVLGPDTERRIYYGTDTRIEAIALGVLTAILVHTWVKRGSPVGAHYVRVFGHDAAFIGAILLYIVSLLIRDEWFRGTFRFSFQAIAACVIIMYGLFPNLTKLKRLFIAATVWKPVAIIGVASYSIYLVHLSLDAAMRPFVAGWPLGARVALLVVVGTVAGIVIYYLIEVPVHNWRVRRTKAKQKLKG